MKKVNFGLSNLILFIFEIILGLLFVFAPDKTALTALVVIGILFILLGIGQIYRYFKMYSDEAAEKKSLARGLILVSVSTFCICISIVFSFTVLLYIALIFIIGIYRLQEAVDMLRVKQKFWQLSLACSAVAVVAPVAFLCVFRFFSAWNFLGAYILLSAVLDVVTFVLILRS